MALNVGRALEEIYGLVPPQAGSVVYDFDEDDKSLSCADSPRSPARSRRNSLGRGAPSMKPNRVGREMVSS